VFVVGVAATVWGFWWEPSSLTKYQEELALPSWPAACDGLTVAVLADLHVGSPYNGLDKLDQIVRQTLALAPDVILMAGDYVIQGVVGGEFVAPEDAAKVLARLKAPLGVFAVLGNHDWWLDAPRVRDALIGVDIVVLEDASQMLDRGDCRFALVGISDYWEGAHDLKKAFKDVPDAAAMIAFTHNPDVFPELPSGVALTIAGHTHGGQVRLPIVGSPIVPSQFGQRYALGHIVENGRHLFVSPGLGTSILPVRLGVPPQISVLRLRRR
jgi:uncharacterized protein